MNDETGTSEVQPTEPIAAPSAGPTPAPQEPGSGDFGTQTTTALVPTDFGQQLVQRGDVPADLKTAIEHATGTEHAEVDKGS